MVSYRNKNGNAMVTCGKENIIYVICRTFETMEGRFVESVMCRMYVCVDCRVVILV